MDSKICIKLYINEKVCKKLNKIESITSDVHMKSINFKNPSMPPSNETVDVK